MEISMFDVNGGYEIYLYRYGSGMDYMTIENRLSKLGEDTRISIRDIKDDDAEEKVRILNSTIVLSRCHKYDNEKDKPSYVDIIRVSKDKYLCILSLCRKILGIERKNAGDSDRPPGKISKAVVHGIGC